MGFTSTGFASPGTKTIVNITAFKVLLVALSKRGHTKTELHEITGLTPTTISRWMIVLSNGPDRLVFIESWRRTGSRGSETAVWRAGYNQFDAPKPVPKCLKKLKKLWRQKQLHKAANKTVLTPTGLIHTSRIVKAPQ